MTIAPMTRIDGPGGPVAVAAATRTAPARPPAAPSLAVWSEFLPFAQVGDQLALLQRKHVALYLAIHQEQIGDPELLALLRRAQARGVEVRAWLLLPDADGYWPNAGNVEQVKGAVRQFLDWTRAAGVAVPWVVLDME